MNENILKLLTEEKYEELDELLYEKSLDFINSDFKDNNIDLGFEIPNFNKLISILDIDIEKNEPEYTDMFISNNTTNIITIYKTKFNFLYFIRKEQFGLADEDAILSCLVYTFSLDNIITEAKNELMQNNIVLKRKKEINP